MSKLSFEGHMEMMGQRRQRHSSKRYHQEEKPAGWLAVVSARASLGLTPSVVSQERSGSRFGQINFHGIPTCLYVCSNSWGVNGKF